MSPTISLLSPPGPSALNIPKSLERSASSASDQPPELFRYASSIRAEVFVHEQHCSIENEIDDDDARSWHWICFELDLNSNNESDAEKKIPVATMRLVPVSPPSAEGHSSVEGPSHSPTTMWNGHEPYIKFGRLATLASHRGLGLGKLILKEAMQWAASNRDILSKGAGGEDNGWKGLALVHSQKEVEGFYAQLGFVTDEGLGVWLEEHIEHVGMWRRI